MKFARHCCQLLLLALLSPTVALALGLGDIHLKSTLDAPLDADIDLVDADVEDLASLKATLASRDTFKRLGADYPSFLGEVTLTPERTADGHTFLRVHSANVANEPFATLLVEVDWARGHLVREYTVLLDPPVFNSQAATNPSVAAPAAGASARSGAVDRAPSASGASGNSATTGAPAVAGNSSAANATSPNGANSNASVEPSTASTASATAAASSTPSAAAPAVSVPSGGSAPAATAASASKSPPSAEPGALGAATDTEAGSRNYTVKSGDTLSSIATQTYGSDRATQMRALVAIYRANPAAFHSNMNVMYAGRVLKLPGDSELEAIGPGEATTEVRQQYATWRGSGGEQVASAGQGGRGQLRLVAPQESAAPTTPPANSSASGASTAGAGGSAATAALQQRVQQLEGQLAESQRLLQMRNADLAALQARVQQEAAGRQNPSGAPAPASAPPSAPVAATQPPAPAVAPPAPSPPVAAPTPAQHAPVAAVPPLRPRVATPPRVAANPKAPRAAASPSRSVLDLLSQYWYALVLLVGVLVAVFAFRWVRSRQEDAFDRSLGELSQPAEVAPASRSDTLPVRAITPARQEPSYQVEESGTHLRPTFEHPIEEPIDEPIAAAPRPVAVEEAPPAEAPVALDQGDPLAEADFHMAYGLYDQAAELVQIAITREPKRRDLKMKLLEVFFVWGNRERFLQTAKELAANREPAPAGEWEKILIMGRQIAPEDPLFADNRGLAGAAKVVDLNLEGGQNRVDFDLLGEPSLSSAPQEAGVELDFGAALGDPSATAVTGESPQLGGNDVDFVLDEGNGASDSTGTTREMPGAGAGADDVTALAHSPLGAGSTETLRIVNSGGEAEAPTVEQPAIHSGDQGTIRQKIDAATRSGMVLGEQTAELAIDDLGLDLSALEGHTDETAMPVDSEAPTLLADLDEDTRRMLEKAETQVHQHPHPHPHPHEDEHEHEIEATGTDATLRAPAPGQAGGRPTTTGTWMFTDTDFAKMAPSAKASPTQLMSQMSVQPQVESGSTSAAISALRSGELDLDLGSFGAKGHGNGGVDLDVGAPPASGEGGHVDTQRLKNALVSDDMSLPDLEPVTLSEVGTKLDLARAYMDMGDPEGARSILSEVMSEGSVSQKQEARRLMEALPG